MKHGLRFSITLLASLGALPALAQEITVTADRIPELLAPANAALTASQLQLEAAEERKGHLARSFLPSLELYAGQESFRPGRRDYRTQPVYGAEAKVNLFNGGRDALEAERRDLGVESQTIALKRVRSEELQRARATYWAVLHLKAKAKLLDAMLKVNQENLEAAVRRIRSGVATQSDRVEFEMNEVNLKRELASTRVAEQAEILNLAVILNTPEGAALAFPEPLRHDHEYESLLRHSEEEHSFLFREAELAAAQGKLSARQAAREWLPRLDAFAAYNQYNQREREEFASARDRTETVAGLRVTMSLSAGLNSSREGRAMEKEAAALGALAGLKQREVEAHFHREVNELKFLHGQVHSAEENIRRAENYYKLSQSEYGRGVKNSPDVLGASERLLDTKLKMLEIVRDFQIAKSHVLAKMGK